MRKMNISVPMIYKDKNGADKTKWINIGNIVIADNGKVFGDINATPVGAWDGSFSCFDKEDRQQQSNHNNVPTNYVDAQGNPMPQQQQQQQSYQQNQRR